MARHISSLSSPCGTHLHERRGVVLLIVMAMLALFAIVGLSFVFYTDAQWIASYHNKQSQSLDLSDVSPERLLNEFLSAQIYGNDNPANSIRGHDFGTNQFGYPGGTVPFSGIGRFLTDSADAFGAGRDVTLKRKFINLTQFPGDPLRQPQEGLNPPYTYYDHNAVFLAAIKPNGELVARSYDRFDLNLNDTTDPAARYYTVRPHKSYHTDFASPTTIKDGDVRNLDGALGKSDGAGGYYFNDSFWIDIGFPIMVAKDGTKYKPLFAPLILDLDNRVNLAAAMNYLGTSTTNSMHGLGAHEINPAVTGAKVDKFLEATEVANLWKSTLGRYGNGTSPKNATAVTLPKTQYYSRLDFSAKSATKMALPKAASFLIFPTFDDPAAPAPGEWSDVNTGTPSQFGYDPLKRPRGDGTNADDSPFAPSNMEALLRWGEKGSPSATSVLMQVMPQSFSMTTAGTAGQKNRHLVTVLSNSLDVPHLAPFFADPNATYRLTGSDDFPKTSVTTRQQDLPTTPASYQGGGEFSPSYNSRTAYLQRVNLQRNLTAYTANAPQALVDRQNFAQDIFTRLLKVTGAKEDVSTLTITDPEYKAAKWLAQLAVNIVDYIDEDEKLTIFNWVTRGATKDYVCGFEQPRLLINETYVSYDNDKADVPNTTMPDAKICRLNVWTELVNPMSTDTVLRIKGNGRSIYRLALSKDNPKADDDGFGKPANLFKDLNGTDCLVTDWPAGVDDAKARPAQDAAKPPAMSTANEWFYLVAPKDTFVTNLDPKFTGTKFDHNADNMSATMTLNGDPNLDAPTIILQRLADPDRDENDDPNAGAAGYNPYVTVDYYKKDYVKANDNVKYSGMAMRMVQPMNSFKSTGRRQPMQAAGAVGTEPTDQMPAMPSTDEPQHTFAEHNKPLSQPFTWMPHLDRPLASLPEILQVATVRPHQVTQEFPFPKANKLLYQAMKDNDSLLWRFLETVSVPDKTLRTTLNAGQISIVSAGKINVLTMQDQLIADALADHRPGVSTFKENTKDPDPTKLGDVEKLYKYITSQRPLAGYSNYQLKKAAADVVELQPSPITALVQDSATQDPVDAGDLFQKTELARKITNNITYTSNVFAVWVTVGFFEVKDDTVSPPKLGAEIGLSEGRNVRHRMFAIVDRTQMVAPDTAFKKVKAATKGNGATVQFEDGTTTPSTTPKVSANWTIRKGMRIIVGAGTANEEKVEVLSVDTASPPTFFKANITKDHVAGDGISLDGYRSPAPTSGPFVIGQSPYPNTVFAHPGPQPDFNVRDYSYIVPYYSIID